MKTEAETVNLDEKMRSKNETEKLLKTENFLKKNISCTIYNAGL